MLLISCHGSAENSRNFKDVVFEDQRVQRLVMLGCRGDAEAMTEIANQGVDPNTTSVDGVRPLKLVLECGNVDGLAMLLELGADPNLSVNGSKGWSAVIWASGDADVVGLEQLLIYGGDPNASATDPDLKPLNRALTRGKYGDGWHAFDTLVTYGADINSMDSAGLTIVDRAVYQSAFCKALELLKLGYEGSRLKIYHIALLHEGSNDFYGVVSCRENILDYLETSITTKKYTEFLDQDGFRTRRGLQVSRPERVP